MSRVTLPGAARRHGPRRALTAALIAVAALPVAGACQASPAPERPPQASPAPETARQAAGGTYVTGAKATDDPCARVVSAIGYLDPLLLPEGEEERQGYDDAVRGRFGYLVGTIREYGARLPGAARDAAREAGDVAQTLSDSRTEDRIRPGLLRDYRAAARGVAAGCAARPSN